MDNLLVKPCPQSFFEVHAESYRYRRRQYTARRPCAAAYGRQAHRSIRCKIRYIFITEILHGILLPTKYYYRIISGVENSLGAGLDVLA